MIMLDSELQLSKLLTYNYIVFVSAGLFIIKQSLVMDDSTIVNKNVKQTSQRA